MRTYSKPALVPRAAHYLCLGNIWRLLDVGMGKVTVDDQGCNEWARGGIDAVGVLSPLSLEG